MPAIFTGLLKHNWNETETRIETAYKATLCNTLQHFKYNFQQNKD